MKQIFYFSFFTIAISILSSCGAKSGTNISGVLQNAENMSIYFDKISLDNTNEILLTSKTDGSGKFDLNFPDGIKPGFYRIRAGVQTLDLVFDGTEKNVEIDADINKIREMNWKITGAPSMEKFLKVVDDFVQKKIDVPQLTEMVKNEPDPLTAFMITSKMFTFVDDFADLHTLAASKLKDKFPKEDWADQYVLLAGELQKSKSRKDAASIIQVGMTAPDIQLPDVNGNIKKLSDYKGKVVLLDFWASWCGPCRKANPHVVEIYNKYKGKGFDVFSVSLDGLDNRTRQALGDNSQVQMNLDRQKERWIEAIRTDNLLWNGHVSDLLKWDSKAAAMYGVSGIPKTFLVDREGKIAAIDPRFNLEESVTSAL